MAIGTDLVDISNSRFTLQALSKYALINIIPNYETVKSSKSHFRLIIFRVRGIATY
jgi:hypothetical protein